jgi:hypothetical protein
VTSAAERFTCSVSDVIEDPETSNRHSDSHLRRLLMDLCGQPADRTCIAFLGNLRRDITVKP